jgi:probable F420-dependent oxidoreductase
MEHGVTAFINDSSVGIVEFATTAEGLGFESIWLAEHDHLPVDTVHPWVEGGTPPDIYKRMPDPFTLLAAAAAVTEQLRLGTSVSLIAEHNPIYLAKQIATLDFVSGGRVEVGVGYGWNKLEMVNNGIDPARPRAAFREKLHALKLLWTEETAAFSGEFVNFSESWSYPKPIQKPHPPVVLGAAFTPGARRDLVDDMDGWMPIRGMTSFDQLAESLAVLRSELAEAGRDPSTMTISLFELAGATLGKYSIASFAEHLASEVMFDRYAAIGVDRFIHSVPVHDPDLFHATIELVANRVGVAGAAGTLPRTFQH